MNKNVLLAMSGGIDSSVSAYLLLEQGYNIMGITLKTYSDKSSQSEIRKSEQNIIDAQIIAHKLKIKHYVIDVEKVFNEKIIKYFTDSYFSGKTPNPCVKCNQEIKWKYLAEAAHKFDCEIIATGHYSTVKNNNGRFYLSKAKDITKDQTFFLWNLSQEYLSKTIFPLGNIEKKEIYSIAKKMKYSNLTDKGESFGVCFLGKNNYQDFIKKHLNSYCLISGNFIDNENRILGKHTGVYNYTIGQKVYMEGNLYYVLKINSNNQEIELGNIENLYKTRFLIEKVNLQKYENLNDLTKFEITNSYYRNPVEAKIIENAEYLKIETEKKIYAPAQGQSIIFYENNDLIGGGIIKDYS